MKQPQSHNYSVAWFKIADFVSRGEKERALGLYRLLSHSIDDGALRLQLEGDILLSCHDERAVHKYEQAALHYQQDERLFQAIALYEQLLILYPHYYLIVIRLIALYSRVDDKEYMYDHAKNLLHTLIKTNNIHLLHQFFKQLRDENVHFNIEHIVHPLVYTLFTDVTLNDDEKMCLIASMIDSLLHKEDMNIIQKVTQSIKFLNEKWYQHIYNYIQNKKN